VLQSFSIIWLSQNCCSFLPETLRVLVGDGSIPPPRAYRTPLKLVKPRYQATGGRPTSKPFQNPFALFLYPDVATLLFFNGIFYSVFYGVTATTSTLFQRDYPYLSETDLGLIYLSLGGGMIFGTVITGTRRLAESHGAHSETPRQAT
jgi:hypothetical protein